MEAPSQEEHSGIQHGEVQAIFPSRGKSVQGDTGKRNHRAGLGCNSSQGHPSSSGENC